MTDYQQELEKSAALRIEYLSRESYRDIQKIFSTVDIQGLTCKSFIFSYILSTNNKPYKKPFYYGRPQFEQTKVLLKEHLLDEDICLQNILDYLKAELIHLQSDDLRQDALYTLDIVESITPQLVWY